MEWYWWALIAVGVVLIAYVKLTVGKKMMAKMQKRKELEQQALED